MCTVTFVPGERGYKLGMNRDEQRSRRQALPPAIRELPGRKALFPREPGGGTWIGVNDRAVSFALINWYSAPARHSPHPVSRGTVIPRLLTCATISDLNHRVAELNLENVSPFRLIAVIPAEPALAEWRWNQRQLAFIRHPWEVTGWFSSAFDEAGAQAARENCLRAWLLGKETPNRIRSLRQLHSGHSPAPGPYSICMHRKDAVTVSFTELSVHTHSVRMRYIPGSPCCAKSAMATDNLLELDRH